MTKIRWTEDKSDNFRGNHGCWCFRLDNARRTFFWPNFTTYKGFKSVTRAFAQEVGASSVTVMPEPEMTITEFFQDPDAVIVLRYTNQNGNLVRKYRKEIPVQEGESRRYFYFTEEEVFGDNPLDGHLAKEETQKLDMPGA